MTHIEAAQRADEIIRITLQYQQNPFGNAPLYGENPARTAQALATFRKHLIEELAKQEPN